MCLTFPEPDRRVHEEGGERVTDLFMGSPPFNEAWDLADRNAPSLIPYFVNLSCRKDKRVSSRREGGKENTPPSSPSAPRKRGLKTGEAENTAGRLLRTEAVPLDRGLC